MGDPLSVAASIVGILAAAGKIIEIVQPFVTNVRDAPKLAVTVHSEVNRVRIVLSSLETYLEDLSAQSTSRASFIQVDHIVVLFTDGVLLFSELETLLAPLKSLNDNTAQIQRRHRVLWASKKNAISTVMYRIQHFLTSLSSILNIFQCRTDLAAMESQRTLELQMNTLLNSNHALAAKVRVLEDALSVRSPTIRSSWHTSPATTPDSDTTSVVDFDKDAAEETSARQSRLSKRSFTSVLRFRRDLEASRVYRRVKRTESLYTVSSSIIGSAAWSVFSGLSLADVSVVSVIALPVYASDIQNAQHYTFGDVDEKELNDSPRDDSSLLYKCMALRLNLFQVPQMRTLPCIHEGEFDGLGEMHAMQEAFRDGEFFTILSSTIFERKYGDGVVTDDFPLESEVTYNDIDSFSENIESEGRWLATLLVETGIRDCKFPLHEGFSVSDLDDNRISAFRRVVLFVSCLVKEYQKSLGIECFWDERNQRRIHDDGFAGSPAAQETVSCFLREERGYINDLERLRYFRNILRDSKYFTRDDVDSLFPNIDAILESQTNFLFALEIDKSVHSYTYLFSGGTEPLKNYHSYVEDYNNSVETMERLYVGVKNVISQNFPDMKDIVETEINFKFCLSKPVRRILAYPTFLNQFLLAGPWTEEQRATIESSLDVTQLIANADKPCLNLVYPYQPAKARWQAHAIESFGDLILFGTLPVVKDSNGPERNFRLYLFDKILWVCKDSTVPALKQTPKFGPNTSGIRIFLRFVQNVWTTADPAKGVFRVYILYGSDEGLSTLTIRFPNAVLLRHWELAIEQQREALHKSRVERQQTCDNTESVERNRDSTALANTDREDTSLTPRPIEVQGIDYIAYNVFYRSPTFKY